MSLLQEQAHDAKQQAQSPEDTEDLSPLPSQAQRPAQRRGGISAEPVTEEDATSYVKKVSQLIVLHGWAVKVIVIIKTFS